MRFGPVERLSYLAARRAFRKYVKRFDLHKDFASVIHPYVEVGRIMLPWVYEDGAVEEANDDGHERRIVQLLHLVKGKVGSRFFMANAERIW